MGEVTKNEVFDRRPFDDFPYLVIQRKNYKIKLGNTLPTIRVFVYQRDNLFGDAMPYNLAGMDIKFRLYNNSRKLIAFNMAIISDLTVSELTFQLKKLDIMEEGKYYGEFVFTDLEGNSFSLPTPDERQRICLIVS